MSSRRSGPAAATHLPRLCEAAIRSTPSPSTSLPNGLIHTRIRFRRPTSPRRLARSMRLCRQVEVLRNKRLARSSPQRASLLLSSVSDWGSWLCLLRRGASSRPAVQAYRRGPFAPDAPRAELAPDRRPFASFRDVPRLYRQERRAEEEAAYGDSGPREDKECSS
jgi:hypothetical protein